MSGELSISEGSKNGGAGEEAMKSSTRNLEKRLTESLRGEHSRLYGREEPLRMLHEAYDFVCQPKEDPSQRRMKYIFLSGESGSGKTRLIQEAFKDKECLFGTGKFEFGGEPAPFAALSNCMVGMVNSMIQYQEKTGDTYYPTTLGMALCEDGFKCFAPFIPNLNLLVTKEYLKHGVPCASGMSEQQGLGRFKFILPCLPAMCCRPDRPIVFFMDDLQWADPSTLELLFIIMRQNSHVEQQHFLFVGSYRKDEVDEEHILTPFIRSLEDQYPDNVMRMELQNHTVQDVQYLASDIMQVEKEAPEYKVKVDEFGEFLHQRTGGNMFHISQMLDYLQDERLVHYDFDSFHFEWDLNKIKSKTDVTDTVAEIITAKLNRLTKEALEVMKLCSVLGALFVAKAVAPTAKTVLKYPEEDVEKYLKLLVKEGLLDSLNNDLMKFVHDKVYESALEQHGSVSTELHLKIGRSLAQLIDVNGFDNKDLLTQEKQSIDRRLLFMSTDHLNSAMSLVERDPEDLEDLARLNLESSRQAAALAAFVPAIKYVETADTCLDDYCWEEDYELTLDIRSWLCEMSLVANKSDQLQSVAMNIMMNAQNDMDKVTAYVTAIEDYVNKGQEEKYLPMAKEILSKMGEPLPHEYNKKEIKEKQVALDELLSSKQIQDILEMDLMTDGKKSAAVKILSRIGTPVIRTLSGDHQPMKDFIMLRMIELTMEYGISPESALSFSTYGVYLVTSHTPENVDKAQRYAALSYSLLELPDMNKSRARVWVNNILTTQWRKSLSSLTDSLLKAYMFAFKGGDLMAGLQAIYYYTTCYYHSGLPLKSLYDDLQKMTKVMLEQKQYDFLLETLPYSQVTERILGYVEPSRKFLDLSVGKLGDTRKMLRFENSAGVEIEWLLRTHLAIMCEETELAEESMEKLLGLSTGEENRPPSNMCYQQYLLLFPDLKRKREKTKSNTAAACGSNGTTESNQGLWCHQHSVFLFSLINIQKAKFEKKRHLKQAYKRDALKYHQQLKKWVVEMKSINSAHKLAILDAEFASLDIKPGTDRESLRSAYDKAIGASVKAGFLPDGALASHLAFRSLPPNANELYWERAVDLYTKWGGEGIVQYLSELKNRSLEDMAQEYRERNENETHEGFRSRRRFDTKHSDAHKAIDMANASMEVTAASQAF